MKLQSAIVLKVVFTKYRREMKGIDWGFLYNEFKDKNFDSKKP